MALLNPVYWPEARRGSERFARELADGLLARGHRPRLITSHRGPPSRRVEDGLEVVRNWRPPGSRRLRRRLFEDHLTHVPLSYASLRRGEHDVAHALFPTDGLAAVRWARRTGRPALLSYMGLPQRAHLSHRRWRAEVLVRAAAGADAVVALSRAAAAAFERDLGVRARVIYPGVDLEAFAPDGERAPAPTILCPAAIEDDFKRVPLLVEAFAGVRRERPGARLVLSRPRDPADADGLARDGVELRDLDERAALARAYREAWVTALASPGEPFGLVLAESLACGTPVVAGSRGAGPEIVTGERVGRLFEGDDPEPLARALLEGLELAGDPATTDACRTRAQEFSIDRCTESYLDLYRELSDAARQ